MSPLESDALLDELDDLEAEMRILTIRLRAVAGRIQLLRQRHAPTAAPD